MKKKSLIKSLSITKKALIATHKIEKSVSGAANRAGLIGTARSNFASNVSPASSMSTNAAPNQRI